VTEKRGGRNGTSVKGVRNPAFTGRTGGKKVTMRTSAATVKGGREKKASGALSTVKKKKRVQRRGAPHKRGLRHRQQGEEGDWREKYDGRDGP